MSSRRTLILLGAIAVGVVAALLLFNYVRGIEDRAYDNAARVTVYTASANIPRGTPGETAVNSGLIEQGQIPQEFRPATAITTPDQVQKKVALFDIPQNTVILDGMFVDQASTQITFRQRLKNPENQAMTIQVDTVRGVGGWLVAGDEVNVLVKVAPGSLEIGEAAAEPVTGLRTSDGATYRYLYQSVQILAVGDKALLSPGEQVSSSGSSSSSAPTGASGQGLLTINVSPEAAPLFAIGQDSNAFYLTLTAEDYVPHVINPYTASILPGEDPVLLTPCGPEGCDE